MTCAKSSETEECKVVIVCNIAPNLRKELGMVILPRFCLALDATSFIFGRHNPKRNGAQFREKTFAIYEYDMCLRKTSI